MDTAPEDSWTLHPKIHRANVGRDVPHRSRFAIPASPTAIAGRLGDRRMGNVEDESARSLLSIDRRRAKTTLERAQQVGTVQRGDHTDSEPASGGRRLRRGAANGATS